MSYSGPWMPPMPPQSNLSAAGTVLASALGLLAPAPLCPVPLSGKQLPLPMMRTSGTSPRDSRCSRKVLLLRLREQVDRTASLVWPPFAARARQRHCFCTFSNSSVSIWVSFSAQNLTKSLTASSSSPFYSLPSSHGYSCLA